MSHYKVKHPADKDCKDCRYFEMDTYEDSFGPVTEVNCKKGKYAHVDYYAEACEAFRESVKTERSELASYIESL